MLRERPILAPIVIDLKVEPISVGETVSVKLTGEVYYRGILRKGLLSKPLPGVLIAFFMNRKKIMEKKTDNMGRAEAIVEIREPGQYTFKAAAVRPRVESSEETLTINALSVEAPISVPVTLNGIEFVTPIDFLAPLGYTVNVSMPYVVNDYVFHSASYEGKIIWENTFSVNLTKMIGLFVRYLRPKATIYAPAEVTADTKFTVSVTVFDEEDIPVFNLPVTLYDATRGIEIATSNTDKNGAVSFSLSLPREGTYTLGILIRKLKILQRIIRVRARRVYSILSVRLYGLPLTDYHLRLDTRWGARMTTLSTGSASYGFGLPGIEGTYTLRCIEAPTGRTLSKTVTLVSGAGVSVTFDFR